MRGVLKGVGGGREVPRRGGGVRWRGAVGRWWRVGGGGPKRRPRGRGAAERRGGGPRWRADGKAEVNGCGGRVRVVIRDYEQVVLCACAACCWWAIMRLVSWMKNCHV